MSPLRSADGTGIAFERTGQGPAVILVDGAPCSRAFGQMPDHAKLLAEGFTVYAYDRRGRNESGDTQPYSVEREVEDIDALVDEAGGSACLSGASSGACLALEAASSGPGRGARRLVRRARAWCALALRPLRPLGLPSGPRRRTGAFGES